MSKSFFKAGAGLFHNLSFKSLHNLSERVYWAS